ESSYNSVCGEIRNIFALIHILLIQHGVFSRKFILLSNELERDILLVLQAVLFLLYMCHASRFLYAHFIELFGLFSCVFNWLLVFSSADDVFQILQQP